MYITVADLIAELKDLPSNFIVDLDEGNPRHLEIHKPVSYKLIDVIDIPEPTDDEIENAELWG